MGKGAVAHAACPLMWGFSFESEITGSKNIKLKMKLKLTADFFKL